MTAFVDVVEQLVQDAKTKAGLSNLNYLYGYLSEVKETLAQDSKTAEFRVKKYPLVWLVQPFVVNKGGLGNFGTIPNLKLFIINGSNKDWKAKQRMDQNYKPVLYPILEKLVGAFNGSAYFKIVGDGLRYNFTDRYYWGIDQTNAINDVFDCIELNITDLKLNKNINCLEIQAQN